MAGMKSVGRCCSRIALFVCSIVLCGCGKPPQDPKTDLDRGERDALFAKKLECGRLLTKIGGSALGPDTKLLNDGILEMNPLVFYNSELNTCVYIHAATDTKTNDVYYDVSDLLTGKDIEMRTVHNIKGDNTGDELQAKYNK